MDFEVTVNDETKVFEQYQEALQYIDGKMAYWNNFESHMGLHIHLEKVKSPTDTIGVNVDDEFKITEHLS